MIRAYGLHWHQDRIYWGRQNSDTAALIGGASRTKKAVEVDFRDQRGIYALYADYELVYVGQTGSQQARLLKRLKDHRTDHLAERWNRFSWIGTQWVTKSGMLSQDTLDLKETVGTVLNILEAISTAIAEPRLNLQRGRWSEATQYFQMIAVGSFAAKDDATIDDEGDDNE